MSEESASIPVQQIRIPAQPEFSRLRASCVLAAFMTLTVPLMPVQALLLKMSPKAARRFPHWYHRQVCRVLGIKLTINGAVVRDSPVLLVSNHTSWLDIPVLSAVAPVSFVAKKEVGNWPFVSSLARLQRTVFVDRTRRHAAGQTAQEIMDRLKTGDAIVLFAEGTSSDGNRVLPFKTSLFAAVKPSRTEEEKQSAAPGLVNDAPPMVQTLAIVYTHLHGLPLGRADRPRVGWYGDMEMQSHAWALLGGGPLAVTIDVSPPVPLSDFADRKTLAISSERTVREAVHRILRDRKPEEALKPVEPRPEDRKVRPTGAVEGEKWT
ncbi:MAG: lysophospholipid acyltransferase family protein [Hyphomicrobiaceae bacterium]